MGKRSIFKGEMLLNLLIGVFIIIFSRKFRLDSKMLEYKILDDLWYFLLKLKIRG